jgi:uncharacterized protein (DUF305 family)
MNMIDDMKMKMDEMTSKQMIETLKSKEGPEFDRMFLEHMIMHHKSGVDMARLAAKKAKRKDIQDMADTMASDQQEEIKEMEEMMA